MPIPDVFWRQPSLTGSVTVVVSMMAASCKTLAKMLTFEQNSPPAFLGWHRYITGSLGTLRGRSHSSQSRSNAALKNLRCHRKGVLFCFYPCVCVCAYSCAYTSSGAFGRQKKASDSLELELQEVVSHQTRVLETELGPLEKWPVLLTTEPSVWPSSKFCLKWLQILCVPRNTSWSNREALAMTLTEGRAQQPARRSFLSSVETFVWMVER